MHNHYRPDKRLQAAQLNLQPFFTTPLLDTCCITAGWFSAAFELCAAQVGDLAKSWPWVGRFDQYEGDDGCSTSGGNSRTEVNA